MMIARLRGEIEDDGVEEDEDEAAGRSTVRWVPRGGLKRTIVCELVPVLDSSTSRWVVRGQEVLCTGRYEHRRVVASSSMQS